MSRDRGRSRRPFRHDNRNAHNDYSQEPYHTSNSRSYHPYGHAYRSNSSYDSYNSYTQNGHSSGFNYWRGIDPYSSSNASLYQPAAFDAYSYTRREYGGEYAYQRPARGTNTNPRREYHAEASSSSAPLLTAPIFRKKQSPDLASGSHPVSKEPSPPVEQAEPLPSAPSESYISISLQGSQPIADPSLARKLLILDLNGTLLIRSQRSAKRRYVPGPGGGPPTAPMPRPRAVQPRPYIPAFRAYIFAPETKRWLDTMVWSSAQPHSVLDMVEKVFGKRQDDLKAIWDRESLGLSKKDYFQKTQTTKDLTKPWKFFSLNPQPETTHRTSPQFHDSSSPNFPSSTSSVAHSALTTLLLDDSPLKARLQPYNHICIPEYSSVMRAKDVHTLELEKLSQVMNPNQQNKHSSTANTPEEAYDATLLAVIGVLDDIKSQNNVAGWIRSGKLRASTPSVQSALSKSFDLAGNSSLREASNEEEGSKTEPTREEKRPEKKHRKRKEEVALRAVGHASPISHVEACGIDTLNSAVIQELDVESQSKGHLDIPSDLPSELDQMWFSDSQTFSYWVTRGRRALAELGIAADHGVTG
ncbi:hypothetical protein BJ138DRAFT_1152948 [Hygrophoropsis aurantiaca]|uniref:Uncharacterized protein n=1 Tax=Hygrophoropsis aurantiaca TaxID=72124 RepID=A0ACB8AAN3_9AGAM|nr:hypothetical protein BJ138DRAFT_1152948 [Hygrophoropsis aurantiaca]